jgi:hypothetical protein
MVMLGSTSSMRFPSVISPFFLVYLAQLAVTRGCGRFEWAVPDWNEPAIRCYRSLGAGAQDEWTWSSKRRTSRAPFYLNHPEFPDSSFSFQLALGKHVLQMFADGLD